MGLGKHSDISVHAILGHGLSQSEQGAAGQEVGHNVAFKVVQPMYFSCATGTLGRIVPSFSACTNEVAKFHSLALSECVGCSLCPYSFKLIEAVNVRVKDSPLLH